MLWVIIMVEGIFIILTLVFCVFGVVFFIQQLALLIASPAISNRAYLVFLSGEAADVELELAINTLSWSKAFRKPNAFAVDFGLSDDMRKKCIELAKNSRFIFIDKKDLSKIVG